MLLPSAFSCDGGGLQPTSRPLRPKLPSFGSYQPQFSVNTRPNPLSSSCRALQAILGGAGTTQHNTAIQPRELSNPFALSENPRAHRPIEIQPHRSANKRRRSEFEEDIVMDECERTPEPMRTPKRRRRVPLLMPMGLSADDFRALDTPVEEIDLDMPNISPQARHSDDDSAYGSSPSPDEGEWHDADDRALVETVLEKLKLSRRDWNDCARMLGKDRDSMERRWGILVGEGNVGLRRGGRVLRPSLEISSW